LLDAFEYIQIDEDVVRTAMVEPDPLLRSLDAIHLATARLLGPELTALLTYDDRLYCPWAPALRHRGPLRGLCLESSQAGV
jgi:hypothetical protein